MSLFFKELFPPSRQIEFCPLNVVGEKAINEWLQPQNSLLLASLHMKSIWGKKYKLLNKLSYGQFGSVYLFKDSNALQNETEKVKVIKFISIDDIMLDETIEAVNEAKLLSRLSCPFIVLFYDSFIEDSMFCIVTEYCEGGDMAMLIKNHQSSKQKIDINFVLDWFIQLSIALRYIHHRKIIHRDLKTRNIFLKRNQVKLGDFGVSRLMKSYNDYANTFAGTPYYMSPEVLKQEGYNFKSDIWSLGCIFYELLMLERPYKGDSIISLLHKIIEDDPPLLPTTLSSELRNLSALMLQKDPRKRPSAKEILQIVFINTNEESLKCKKLLFRYNSLFSPQLDNNDLPQHSSLLESTQEKMPDFGIPSDLTPGEQLLQKKESRADSIVNVRCTMAQVQVKENHELFLKEKLKTDLLPKLISGACSVDSNSSLSDLSFVLEESTIKFDFSKLSLNGTSNIPYDPTFTESFYLENEEFEELTTSENEIEYSAVEDQYTNFINNYDNIPHILENSLDSIEQGNFQSKSQIISHHERIKLLRNECISVLGPTFFYEVYDFLRVARFGVNAKGDGILEDEGYVQMKLSEITSNRNGCFLVDQLVFFERL